MIAELYKKLGLSTLFDFFNTKKRELIDSDDEDEDINLHQPPFKRNRFFDRSVESDIRTDLMNSNRISDAEFFSCHSNISPSSSIFGMAKSKNIQRKKIPIEIDIIETGFKSNSQDKENESTLSSKYFTKTHDYYDKVAKELIPHSSKYFGRELSKHDEETDIPVYKSPTTYSDFRFKPSVTSTAFKLNSSNLGITKRKPIKTSGSPRSKFPYHIPLTSKFGIQKRFSDVSRANKMRSLTRSLAPCGIGRLLTTRESFRLDEKERYRQLLQQYTTSSVFPRKTRSPFLTSTVDGAFASEDIASRSGAIVKTHLDPITSSRSRLTLEKSESCPIKSATLVSQLSANLDLSSGEPKSPLSVTGIPVIDLEPEGTSQLKLDDDIFVIKEIKPSPTIKNSLEDKLQKSIFYSHEWLKDIKKYQEEKNKTTDDDVQLIYETKKKCEESRKQCEKELLDKVEKRISQLDLTYPRAYIEVTDEEEEVLPELTPEIQNVIDRAFKGGPPGQVLAEKFNIQIRRRDLHTLAGLNWLNDEVINFYMNMLVERGQNDNYPSVYAFNTFFYSKLGKTGYGSVKRWTKKVDIFSYDLLLIPVHLGMHWCLSTVDFRNKTIKYYDSMLGDNNKCLVELRKYLESEHQDKKKKNFDVSAFSSENVKEIPQQMNGSDCGMFSCKFAEYLSRNASITFNQEHMPYFRKRMVYEIVTKRLM